jgi:hypothetical protein
MDSQLSSGTAHIICDILDLLNFVADGLNTTFVVTDAYLIIHGQHSEIHKLVIQITVLTQSLSVHCENCTCMI